MPIGYASQAAYATQTTHTNVPNTIATYSQTIASDDTAQTLDPKGRVLMCRLYASAGNASTIYVGASNVSDSLFFTKLVADDIVDITIDRTEKIYIYGKDTDTLMVTYFQGGDA